MEDETKNSVKFTDHLFDGSGNNIMNSIQYTAMCIIPLLLVNHLLETQLPVFSQHTPPVTLVIEIAIHMVILLIVLYFVDRVVRFFPSASGDTYGSVSFETIGMILVLLVVNARNSNLGKKLLHLTRNVRERFIGQEGMDNKHETNHKNKPEETTKETTEETVNANLQKLPQPPPPITSDNTNVHLTNHRDIPAKVKVKEGFEPSSSLEGFAIGGGNYSVF